MLEHCFLWEVLVGALGGGEEGSGLALVRAGGTARVNFEASLVTVCVDRGLVRSRATRRGRRGEREAIVLPRRIAVRDDMAELRRASMSYAAMEIWRHGRRAVML